MQMVKSAVPRLSSSRAAMSSCSTVVIVMIFLGMLVDDEPIYFVGLIPLLIGLVLVIYGFFMAPRTLNRDRSGAGRPE